MLLGGERASVSGMFGRVLLLVLAASALPLESLWAQGSWGFDTQLRTHYVWRGITRRNAWVWQSDVVGGYRVDGTLFTGGAWMTFELTRADVRIDEALGLGARVGEFNGWVEAARTLGPVDVALGFTLYRFIDEAEAAALGNTVFDTEEAYVRAAVHAGRFTATTALWQDFRVVKGAYAELGASYHIPVLPLAIPIVRVGALTGFSLGQGGAQPAYFTGSGVTHLEVYTEAQLSFGLGGLNLYLIPGIHVQINRDDATRRTRRDSAGLDNDLKAWAGISISWHSGLQ